MPEAESASSHNIYVSGGTGRLAGEPVNVPDRRRVPVHSARGSSLLPELPGAQIDPSRPNDVSQLRNRRLNTHTS